MTTFKKTLSAFLAAIMIICAMSAASVAFAEAPVYFTDGSFKFAVIGEDGAETARLVKIDPNIGEQITLPVSVSVEDPETEEVKTYVITEVEDGVFAPTAADAVLKNDIKAISLNALATDELADYDTFINAYAGAFEGIESIEYLFVPNVMGKFAKAVKEDGEAALSERNIDSAEALTDYIAAGYYKYTTAVCDALGLDYVKAYLPVSSIGDEVASSNNGCLYTAGVSAFYLAASEALDAASIPSTLLVVPPAIKSLAINPGTARISGYAFANKAIDELGIPDSVTSFGKGTYAAGDAEPAVHNTFETAVVKAVEIRTREFSAVIASGLIKEGIEVYAVSDFAFSEYVKDNGGTYNEIKPTRVEEAAGVLQRLAAFFSRIIEFFKQLLERIRG